ncbi:MAG TPA: putative lipid II flippase FtsW [Candidatus Saccharimonadales bacterium]
MRPRAVQRQSRLRPAPASKTTARRHRPDYWLVMLCALLLAIGLVVVYSIGPAIAESAGVNSNYYVNRQLIAIALSVVAFVVTSKLPLERWQSFQKPLLIAAVIATGLALISPLSEQYQEHRWVRLGSFTFQSVELVKLAVTVWLATLLAKNMTDGSINDPQKTLKPLAIAVGVLGVVIAVLQSDLGSAAVLMAIMGIMVFVAGMPLKKIVLFGSIILIGATMAIASTPYRRERLQTFLNPTADCQDTGYQACQAMNAVGSGGLIGLGLGSSVQAYGYLPEAANDSIFAIYAEKFGFVGTIILLAIFGALFTRIAMVAERAPDNFSRLLVVGVLTWLSVQSVVNIGAMLGLLPLKGITLPFISYGGTSVVFIAAAIGIVFQVSRYTALSAPRMRDNNDRRGYDDSRHGRRVRGAYHPDFSGRA